jgi:hypothetical protein
MADACMPEKFYEVARPMLPLEKEPSPAGGRPPTTHRIVLRVIWFVLVTCTFRDLKSSMRPGPLGVWQGQRFCVAAGWRL